MRAQVGSNRSTGGEGAGPSVQGQARVFKYPPRPGPFLFPVRSCNCPRLVMRPKRPTRALSKLETAR